MSNEEKPAFAVGSKSYTAVAVNTAARAGEWIKSKIGEYENLSVKTSHHDLVTEVDKGSELMIKKLLHTYFPEHGFLGEESAEPGSAGAIAALQEIKNEEYIWIVDPLDGTTNFIHGFPFFSVSIALAYRGEVIVGVVYDPSKDEMFVAEKGKGAYLRGRKTSVGKELKLSESLIATGFPADRSGSMPVNMRGVQALAPQVRNIRVAGSAALHLAYVAAGRLSGFWEIGLNAWDMAAGYLLVKESGGMVTDTHGNPYSLECRNVAASNGHIHQQLLQALQDADAAGSQP